MMKIKALLFSDYNREGVVAFKLQDGKKFADAEIKLFTSLADKRIPYDVEFTYSGTHPYDVQTLLSLLKTVYIDLSLDTEEEAGTIRTSDLLIQIEKALDEFGVNAHKAFVDWLEEEVVDAGE